MLQQLVVVVKFEVCSNAAVGHVTSVKAYFECLFAFVTVSAFFLKRLMSYSLVRLMPNKLNVALVYTNSQEVRKMYIVSVATQSQQSR